MQFKINHDTPANRIGYGVIPADKRGVIKTSGVVKASAARKGGDKTNALYAKENDITRRQASKQRRGY